MAIAEATTAATSSPSKPVRCCLGCRSVFRGDFDLCPLDGGELVLSEHDPLVATLVGDYLVDAVIGEGGMGRVYLAHHWQFIARRVAIKVLLGDLAASSLMRDRFAREVEAAQRLSHPNIVQLLDAGTTAGGVPYLVMDYVPGTTLADILFQGPMPGDRVIRIARQLCAALDHAHSRGVIHRDFKPDNVLVVGEGADECVKMTDFGLALSTGISRRLTQTGVACTPAYAAPEQLRGGPIDSRVDLYGLGTTMFEMLTGGMLPFEGDVDETTVAKLGSEAPSLRMIVPGVQPALATLIGRLLSHYPQHRPHTARAVMIALDAAQTAPDRVIKTIKRSRPSLPTPAPAAVVAFPSPRARRTRSRMFAALVIAALIGAIAGVIHTEISGGAIAAAADRP